MVGEAETTNSDETPQSETPTPPITAIIGVTAGSGLSNEDIEDIEKTNPGSTGTRPL